MIWKSAAVYFAVVVLCLVTEGKLLWANSRWEVYDFGSCRGCKDQRVNEINGNLFERDTLLHLPELQVPRAIMRIHEQWHCSS